jgi:hypothetical protein
MDGRDEDMAKCDNAFDLNWLIQRLRKTEWIDMSLFGNCSEAESERYRTGKCGEAWQLRLSPSVNTVQARTLKIEEQAFEFT